MSAVLNTYTTYTISTRDLAARLQVTPLSIRQHRSGMPGSPLLDGLPQPIQSRPRCLWLIHDIEAWLDSKRTFRPAADVSAEGQTQARQKPRPRRGRATKSEVRESEKLGVTVKELRRREVEGGGV